MIHPTAVIDPSAQLAEGVSIGAYSIIGPSVSIGAHTWIGPHVVIRSHTRLGTHNKIYQFASIGEDPQDKKYQDEITWLEIGNYNVIRECVTINRGTVQGGGKTQIGDRNLLMAYVHIAHDCLLHNDIICANNATLAGHVIIENYAILSGFTMVHQFCLIGAHSFIAAAIGIGKDVLPYLMVSGNGRESKVFGLNTEGLKRRGFSDETLQQLKRAYKVIFRKNLTITEVIAELQLMTDNCAEVASFIDVLANSTRGIIR